MQGDGSNWWAGLRRRGVVTIAVLGSLGLLALLILWFSRSHWLGGSFRTVLLLPQAHGIEIGTPVTYRGVEVGRVIDLNPKPQNVAIELKIWPGDRLIPSNSSFKAMEVKGKTVLEITPLASLPPETVVQKPLDANCDPKLILCAQEGNTNPLLRPFVTLEDINTSATSIDRGVQDVRTSLQDMNSNVKDISEVAEDAKELLVTVTKKETLDKVDTTLLSVQKTAESLNQAADKIGRLSDTTTVLLGQMRQTGTVDRLNSSLNAVEGAATQIKVFMALNQNNLAATLSNIQTTSKQLTLTLRQVDSLTGQIEQGKLLSNLETIATNSAELSANLRNFSTELNDPQTILKLQQILDSARVVFENFNKITSDVDEITGNPQFRQDLIRIIEGLNKLLSSTSILQEQLAYSQALNQVSTHLSVPPQNK